ncbi:hypothetical protein COV19_00870 [Candidatus Woesearchaeota archaeon CG10_big_fil_rev_8_21_14_0_10_44_13]|nr:MAG: hypothetical protein COV19_00870 [Candidatus Woesearchaeota archaeon CG10_big_fil_rev_8_21_14_0_10_44_13]
MLFWILIIAAFILLTALFFAILKGILKALASALGVISVILIILGVWAILDARSFVEESKTPGQLFVLDEDGRMLAGVNDLFMQDKNATKKMTEDELSSYYRSYRGKDIKGILKDKKRVFVIDMSAFDTLTESDFGPYEGLSRDFVFSALRSDNAAKALLDKTIRESNVTGEYEGILRDQMMEKMPPESEIRSSLFNVLLDASMRKQGPAFLLGLLKEGKMDAYPNSMMFRAIKVMPMSVFRKAESMMK